MKRTILPFVLLLALASVCRADLALPPDPPTIIYVSPDGHDNNSGYSWELAKRTVQEALRIAPQKSVVWVAAGVYTTTTTFDVGYLQQHHHEIRQCRNIL